MKSSGKPWVYTFQSDQIRGFDRLWDEVRQLSFVPEAFSLEDYERHLSQPALAAASDAIEHHPTTEMISAEFSTSNKASPQLKPLPENRELFNPRNGVVKLGPIVGKQIRARISRRVKDLFGEAVLESGNYLYPPGGFKEWHTNVNSLPGWRMYIVDVAEPEQSFFRYIDPDTLESKTVWDRPGTVNIFHVNSQVPLWHAVKSISTYRWSRGFIIPDGWQDTLVIDD